jgi:hypothetical protein
LAEPNAHTDLGIAAQLLVADSTLIVVGRAKSYNHRRRIIGAFAGRFNGGKLVNATDGGVGSSS